MRQRTFVGSSDSELIKDPHGATLGEEFGQKPDPSHRKFEGEIQRKHHRQIEIH